MSHSLDRSPGIRHTSNLTIQYPETIVLGSIRPFKPPDTNFVHAKATKAQPRFHTPGKGRKRPRNRSVQTRCSTCRKAGPRTVEAFQQTRGHSPEYAHGEEQGESNDDAESVHAERSRRHEPLRPPRQVDYVHMTYECGPGVESQHERSGRP
jgi:hypothetical protein